MNFLLFIKDFFLLVTFISPRKLILRVSFIKFTVFILLLTNSILVNLAAFSL